VLLSEVVGTPFYVNTMGEWKSVLSAIEYYEADRAIVHTPP